MKRHQDPRLTIAACLLASSASAASSQDGGSPTLDYRLDQVIDLEQAGLAGPLLQRGVAWGDFDGTLRGTMTQVVDSSVYWTQTPYASSHVVGVETISTAVLETVVLETAENDVLVASTGSGLLLCQYDDATDDLVSQPIPNSAAWGGATRLRAAPRELGQPQAVWGVAGSDVLVGELDGTALTTTVVFDFPATVYGFGLHDYDGDGFTDFVVVCEYGAYVYSQDLGTGVELLRRETFPASAGGCVAFRSIEDVGGDATTVERLAVWYRNVPGTATYVVVVDGGSSEPALQLLTPVAQTPLDVVPSFLAVGDIGGDGQEDLAFQVDRQHVLCLRNLADASGPAPTNHFGLGNGEWGALHLGSDPTLPAAPGQARLFFGDCDGEPGADLLVPFENEENVPATHELHVVTEIDWPQGPIESWSGGDLISDWTAYDDSYDFSSAGGYETGADLPTFALALDIPPRMIDENKRGFTHLEVSLYHETSYPGPIFHPEATQTLVHPLITQQQPLVVRQRVLAVPRDDQGMVLSGQYTPNLVWQNGDRIWVRLRFVKFNDPPPASGPINEPYEDASRQHVTVFSLRTEEQAQGDPPDTDHAQDLLPPHPGAGPLAIFELLDLPLQGNTRVGFHITQNFMPPVPTNPADKHLGIAASEY